MWVSRCRVPNLCFQNANLMPQHPNVMQISHTVLMHFLTFSSHLCCHTKDPSMDFYPWKSCPFIEVMVVTFLSSLCGHQRFTSTSARSHNNLGCFLGYAFWHLWILLFFGLHVSIFALGLSLHSQLLKQKFLRSPGSYMQSLPPHT